MSTKQPVYFISNTDRKDDFLIETLVWKEGGSYYVEKRPASEKANAHLALMKQSYKKLVSIKRLNDLVKVSKPRVLDSGSVRFEYTDGFSPERALLETVLNEDQQGAFDIIDYLFKIIDSLPTVKVNPTANSKYIEVFGDVYNETVVCTQIGVIDLNLDNFLVSKNDSWHLFDYEWMFEFAVPKEFLKARFFWYFISRHSEVFRFHSTKTPSYIIGQEYYVPKFLYDHYAQVLKDLHKVCASEYYFQLFVLGKKNLRLDSLSRSPLDIAESDGARTGMDSFADKVSEKITASLREERQIRAGLEQEIALIKSSRSYRYSKKISSISHRLLP